MNLKVIFTLLKDTFSEWKLDKSPRLGAALAYYTVFSLSPLLIIVVAIAGFAFGREAVEGQIVEQIQGLVGKDSAKIVQTMIESARAPGSNIIATIVGIVTLLIGAAGVFNELQDALNTIWRVKPKPGPDVMEIIKNYLKTVRSSGFSHSWGQLRLLPQTLMPSLRNRFMSFTVVLGVGFLLLVSLVVSAALAALDKFLGGLLPSLHVLQVVNFIVSFGVITALFAMIYKVLPDVEIAWSNVWIGAALTSLLFTIGKFLIGLYLGNSSVASPYGAAGSLVIILIWIYYSAQILFFGAEFTKVYTRRYSSQPVPKENADSITEKARE
jgi:membrane protein